MADIGPLVIKLVADAEGVTKGVAAAVKSLTSGVADMARSAQAMFEKALGSPGRFFADEVIGGFKRIAGAVPVLGPILALPFEAAQNTINGMLDTYDQGIKRIKMFGEAAQRVSMDLRTFHPFAILLGGEDPQAATRAILRFQSKLAEAAFAGPGDHNVFTRLGLDAQALLAKGNVAEAFLQVSDKVKGFNNEVLVSSTAVDLFGSKVGGTMVPALLRGRQRFDEIRAAIEGFGGAFGASDFAMIKKVEWARKQLDFLKQGFTNQVTLGVSPILTALTAKIPKLLEMGITFKGLGDIIVNAFESGGAAVARFLDFFTEGGVWGVVKAGFDYAVAGVKVAAVELGKAIGTGILTGIQLAITNVHPLLIGMPAFLRQIPGLGALLGPEQKESANKLASEMAAQAAAAGSALGKAWDFIKKGAVGTGVKSTFYQDLFKALMGDIRKLQSPGPGGGNNPFAFFMTAADRFLEKIDTPLDTFMKGMNQIAGLADLGAKALDGMAASAAKLNTAASQRFGTWLGRTWNATAKTGLAGLMANLPFLGQSALGLMGAGGGDLGGAQAIFDRFKNAGALEANNLFNALRSAYGISEYKPVGAMVAGSQEEYATRVADSLNARQSIEEQMKDILEEANRMHMLNLKNGEDVVAALQKMGLLRVAGAP